LPWILAAALALRLLLFTGIQGNDDVSYYASAARVARGGPIPKSDLLQTRFALVAPVAALFRLFGAHATLLLLPSLVASLALIALAYRLGSQRYSVEVGRAAAILTALSPLDIFYATASNTDVPLAMWLAAGVSALWSVPAAPTPAGRALRSVLGGLAFGAAHLTKESAVLLLLPLLPVIADRRHRRGFLVAIAVFAVVVGMECLAYFLWTGNPFHRVAVARGITSGGSGGFLNRLLLLPSLCVDLRTVEFPFTGGLMILAAGGCAWALARDRARSGGIAGWWLGSGLILALFPVSLIPYRPAVQFQARMIAVLILPGALLAASLVVERLLPLRPKVTGLALAGVAALALVCAVRLHTDGVRNRAGVEWAHKQLTAYPGATVLTDPRSAQLLRMEAADAPVYTVRAYTAADPPPAPGTLCIHSDRMSGISAEWDQVRPPAWWRNPPPPRKTLAELVTPAPWRLRGARGPDERTRLSRIGDGE